MMKALNKQTVIKFWGILVVTLVTLGMFGPAVNANNVTTVSQTPTAVRGTWYSYAKASGKTSQLVITKTTVGTTSGQAAQLMNIAMCSHVRVSTTKVTRTQLKRHLFNRIYVVKYGKKTVVTTNNGGEIVRTSKKTITVKVGSKTLTFYQTQAQARAAVK